MPQTISIVVPCFNESEVLPLLFQRLEALPAIADVDYEFILIDDGSTDDTWSQLHSIANAKTNWTSIRLSRNFGHQKALWIGLQNAKGDAVFVLDADLQDPPELIVDFVKKWQEGEHVVYGVRKKRKEIWWKRTAYRAFYRLLRSIADIEIPLDAGDFCLMDRKVVNAILQQQDPTPFIRGARAWAGFRQTAFEYERDARAAGKEKYGIGMLLDLAFNGLISYSRKPARWILFSGIAVLAGSLMWTAIWLGTFLIAGDFAGMSFSVSLISSLIGLGTGMNLVGLGVVGEFLTKALETVRSRPVAIVEERAGAASEPGTATIAISDSISQQPIESRKRAA